MLQIWLTALLAIELALYAGLAYRLLEKSMSGAQVAAIIVLLAFLWRLSHALGSYLVVALLRWRDGRTLPFGNSLAGLVSELKARLASYNWSQPFPGLALGVDPVGARDGTPILLVHGFFSNRGMWVRFRRGLAAAGLGPVYTITLNPPMGAIDLLSEQLQRRIEEICAETGRARIVVIAHSMGGLVTRAYLSRCGGARVQRLVTLGSPHHGTRMAAFGIGKSAKEMRRGGDWLASLARAELAAAHGVPVLSIYTLNDDLVYPPESAVLAGAENVPVTGVGHVGLLFSEKVLARVVGALMQK